MADGFAETRSRAGGLAGGGGWRRPGGRARRAAGSRSPCGAHPGCRDDDGRSSLPRCRGRDIRLARSPSTRRRRRRGTSTLATLRRVPWARFASAIVVATPGGGLAHCKPVDAIEGSNLAGEPRDDVALAGPPLRISSGRCRRLWPCVRADGACPRRPVARRDGAGARHEPALRARSASSSAVPWPGSRRFSTILPRLAVKRRRAGPR